MNSTDMTTAGVRTVTSPAVGLRCSLPADQIALMAPYAAPWNGAGLSISGAPTAVRLRGLLAAAGTTGFLATGAPVSTGQPSVHTTALAENSVVGASARHTSSTPGDLPPEDPLG